VLRFLNKAHCYLSLPALRGCSLCSTINPLASVLWLRIVAPFKLLHRMASTDSSCVSDSLRVVEACKTDADSYVHTQS